MIAVLATCFNRKDMTLAGLAAMRSAMGGLDYRVFLVDDGSTDGTGAAVAAAHPEVKVIRGDGSLFWNGGMRKAWLSAIPDAPDYYLWWNDDLAMVPDSIAELMAFQKAKEAEHGPKVIVIGKVADPQSGAVTYGGYVRPPGISRLRFLRAPEGGGPCDTMNGNCVLIPARAVQDVGVHSDRFTHSSGDVDYGLRAREAGYKLFQSPHVVGYTPYNAAIHAKRARLTWSTRRFILHDPKGIPVKEWLYFCRMHGGLIWPVNFIYRYIKILRLTP
jgi:GT2 family glycosyltransferase